jgi:hypothetical protein
MIVFGKCRARLVYLRGNPLLLLGIGDCLIQYSEDLIFRSARSVIPVHVVSTPIRDREGIALLYQTLDLGSS